MPATPNNSAATKADLEVLKSEMREQFSEMREQFSDMRQQFSRMHEYIDERTRDMQTELLRAFADYTHSTGIRFQKLEADTSNIDASATKRLAELERQMTDFRLRLIALEGQR